jgi:hypothetical protein
MSVDRRVAELRMLQAQDPGFFAGFLESSEEDVLRYLAFEKTCLESRGVVWDAAEAEQSLALYRWWQEAER